MSYECEDCGASFDTLSRLRLHDCAPDLPADESISHGDGLSEEDPFEDSSLDRQELEQDHPEVVGDLPDLYDDAREGDVSTLYRAIAEYERVLSNVARGDAPSGEDLLHDLQFAYYESFATGLDTAAQTDGWDVLVEFATAYDPREQDEFPEVSHVIANAIGRSVIRTRRGDSVDAIPADALAFLDAIPEYVNESHVAYEESYTYGWGIGHPEHSVADHLLALSEDESKFVKITLNTAFYVDQYAALDAFEAIVTDEDIASGTRSTLGMETDLTEFYFQAVADLETEELLGPHAPPYWDEDDDLTRVIDVDPDVKQRIRELAHETGVTETLPSDWALHDLETSSLSELMGRIGDSPEREL
ncbi:hypothetical protein [Halorubrum amylolyticum]|uniref:hypothetical protein n=1 Tax=Halorubrum amylolyticum TaxID=2508724 RepID=UPI001008D499|nr:hypothetical protein [Halorubrum amylolyticum]